MRRALIGLTMGVMLLSGCGTVATRTADAWNSAIIGGALDWHQYRPLKVERIRPSEARLDAVRQAQVTPQPPYTWDLTLEVW